jgi:hypothetical protein
MKSKLQLVLLFAILSNFSQAEIYTIEDDFDGCDHGKVYPLTNGQFLQCEQYKYFYKYRPKVIADGRKVIAIDEREVRGRIVDGQIITTQIDGEWEGCDFDVHRLVNGMKLICGSYFYEYAYMPTVAIIIIDGSVQSVSINGTVRDSVTIHGR